MPKVPPIISKIFQCELCVNAHQVNADENARLICDKVIDFNTIPRKLWIRFESEEEYQSKQKN
jgi:hypothetical protein